MSLEGKTALVTGSTSGIGLGIAQSLARAGADLILNGFGDASKVVAELEQFGGKVGHHPADVSDPAQIADMLSYAEREFGGIDILVNNASAISLTGTLSTPMKRYDLMHQINLRGTFLVSQKCIPHLTKAKNPHVLNLSPPLDMHVKWFAPHGAYTMAKFGMSMCAWAMAEEFRDQGIAFNCLWPRTTIATSAIRNLLGGDEMMKHSRTPEIMGDAAYAIFNRPSRACTGNFFIDDEVLKSEGVTDLDKYAVSPGSTLAPDLFVPGHPYGRFA